jgi:CRP-like cAMP-binding protein
MDTTAAPTTSHGGKPGSNADRLSFLGGVKLFGGLPAEVLSSLSMGLTEEAFVDEARIVKEGDAGDTLYILLDGEATVMAGGSADRRTVLATLKPKDFFGELAMFDEGSRSATVHAKGVCKLLRMPRSRFKEIAMRHPELLWNMCAALAGRLRATNVLITSPKRAQKQAKLPPVAAA